MGEDGMDEVTNGEAQPTIEGEASRKELALLHVEEATQLYEALCTAIDTTQHQVPRVVPFTSGTTSPIGWAHLNDETKQIWCTAVHMLMADRQPSE